MKHPDIDRPDSVTHFMCPDGPTKGGVPDATHHLQPKSAANGKQQHVCSYCKKTEEQLKVIHGL